MTSAEHAQLRTLNEQMFQAEAGKETHGRLGTQFLKDVLSEHFVLRRSSAAALDEGKDELLRKIAVGTPGGDRALVHEEVLVWEVGTLAVVAGPVDMVINGVGRRFQNVRVFTRESTNEGWKCVYWQVTEKPAGTQRDAAIPREKRRGPPQ